MLWSDCNGAAHIRPIQGLLYRLVESQEQVATLGYVDNLDEQALLEQMLDQTKPPYPEGSGDLHYLLKTPFRYPPLQWGSRFGRVTEASIFYGAASIKTTLAESAYYRLVFWNSIDAAPIKDKIRTEHTLFSARYKTTHGVQLQQPPFDLHVSNLAHPSNYAASQSIGSDMREAGVRAFEYESARDHGLGACIGLFSPQELASKRPLDMSQWLCEVTASEVSFKQVGSREVTTFLATDFMIDGDLPLPA